MDVCGDGGAVFFRQGARLLHGGGVSDAAGDGRGGSERWLAGLRLGRRTVEGVYFAGIAVIGVYVMCDLDSSRACGAAAGFALKNNGDLREEFGWNELVKTVAGIRDSLPAEQQENLGIIVGNYGEQGAIEMLGPAYHLPPPISSTNSAWLRGYPARRRRR